MKTVSDEIKLYPLLLHESAMKKIEEVAVAKNKKAEDIIEGFAYQLVVAKPEKPLPPKRTEGWWRRKGIMKKFHYFVDGRSLCRGYGWPDYTQLDADTGNVEAGKEDCAACFSKLVKRRETLGVKKSD